MENESQNESTAVTPEPPVAEAVVTTEQPPARRGRLPSGELVVTVIEGLTDAEVPEADRTALMEISDDAAAAAFLKAKLGPNMEISTLEARDVFSSWLFRKISVKPMLLTMQMATIEEMEAVSLFGREALDRDRLARRLKAECDAKCVEADILTPEQSASYLRVLAYGASEKSKALGKAQKMALEVQPQPLSKTPKNRPPEIVNQTNIVVQR